MLEKFKGIKLYLGVLSLFIIVFAIIYGVYGSKIPFVKQWSPTQTKIEKVKPVINENTVIKREIRYLCGDKVSTRIPTTSDLIGMDFAQLVKKFPVEDGWSIDDSIPNTLIITRFEERVCPYHREFRHLGIKDGFLAVYEGPLGFNHTLLQQEEIPIEQLPPEVQEDLNNVMNYNEQSQDIQGRLKALYEFETENQLGLALENFDEFR